MTQAEFKAKERLRKRVAKGFYEGFWRYRGTEFVGWELLGVSKYLASTRFTCNHVSVKVRIETEEEYGIEDSVKMFVGENAAEECIQWATDRLWELYVTVSARMAPYESGYRKYQRALKGERL